jgi:hypothetical protein
VRERLITLVCALGALGVLVTLFWRGDGSSEERVSRPTTVERGDNGLLGAISWLKGEGVRTLSFRERFSTLASHRELQPTGNLMIVTLPASSGYSNAEVVALDNWIRSGNTLIVLAALQDRPRWAPFPHVMDQDLQLLTGLELLPQSEENAAPGAKAGPQPEHKGAPAPPLAAGLRAEPLPETQRLSLVPNRPHRYFDRVTRAVALSDYPARASTLAVPRDGFALALAHAAASGAPAFWLRSDGAGSIIVSGFSTLFTNRALGTADNARLLANIVAATLGSRGTVVFDDQHQGLTAAYDPAKFYHDRRLYQTIGVLAATWLVWVLGATRLKMGGASRRAPREADLVRTTGLFLARVLRPAAAARQMFADFFRRLRLGPQSGQPHPGRLWEWLENHPRVARSDVQQLQRYYAAAYADQRVSLVRLHNLILATERQIAA